MSTLYLLSLFASLFAVPSAGECILSPDSVEALNKRWNWAVQYRQTLTCHAEAEPERKWEDFKPVEEGNLGSGSSASVVKVKVEGNDPSRVFAMKVYHSTPENWRALNEVIISTILSHDPEHHFVKPYYFFLRHSPENVLEQSLVMEYVAGGDLHRLVNRIERVHWEDTIPLAYLLLQALKYAHSQGVIYRDLKPENILLDAETGFKIADFDQAARFYNKRYYPKDPAGTLLFMAPEYFLNEPRTETVDTWTVGATLWTAIEGRYMHVNNSAKHIMEKFYELVEKSKPIALPAAIPEEGLGGLYRKFLNKLLEFESFGEAMVTRKKRLTCAEMLKSKEGNDLFAEYKEKTGRKLTEPAFLPRVVEGKLIGYNYLGRQQEHYRDLGVLPKRVSQGDREALYGLGAREGNQPACLSYLDRHHSLVFSPQDASLCPVVHVSVYGPHFAAGGDTKTLTSFRSIR